MLFSHFLPFSTFICFYLSKLLCVIQSSKTNKHQVSTLCWQHNVPRSSANMISRLKMFKSVYKDKMDLLFQIRYLYQLFTFIKSMGQTFHTLLIVCGNVLLAANTVRWLFVEMPCVHHGQPQDSWLMLHASSNHQTSLNVYYHPFCGDQRTLQHIDRRFC